MNTQELEVEIFKKLAYKSALEIGLEHKFDTRYKDNRAIRNAVLQIYRKLSKQPDKYGLSPDLVETVKGAVGSRSVSNTSRELAKAEKEIETDDIKTLALGVRDKAFRLIDRKLQRASKSNKRLDAVSFRDLGIIAGIAFDKSQIISGQATENIAVHSKIDGNLNPVDAIALVLKMREQTAEAKNVD